LQQLPATCVCILVSGLHGCGKSALCNILWEVLGGTWLNYDDFACGHAGKNLRQAFATEVRATLTKALAQANRDRKLHVVVVDRSNTLKAHRGDLLQELKRLQWRKRGCKALLVDFTHPGDIFGYGADGQLSKRYSEQHVSLCIGRIEERGLAHPSLYPSPKLRAMLQSAAQAANAPTPDEVTQFDGRVSVNVLQAPPEAARAVLDELRSRGWVPSLASAEELLPRTEVAWQAYQRAEKQKRQGVEKLADPAPHEEFRTQVRKVFYADKAQAQEMVRAEQQKQSKPTRTDEGPVPLLWKINLPEVSGVLSQRGILPASFIPVEKPHSVVLRLDAVEKGIMPEASFSAERLTAMREALEALQGEDLELRMTEIVIEESVACAVIELPPIVPCSAKVPHVTLGTKPGVSVDSAGALLERVKAGNVTGVTCIQLPKPRPLTGRLMLEYSSPGSA